MRSLNNVKYMHFEYILPPKNVIEYSIQCLENHIEYMALFLGIQYNVSIIFFFGNIHYSILIKQKVIGHIMHFNAFG